MKKALTHWARVTDIRVGKLTIIGSDNGLSPGRRQAIIWTNAGKLFIWPLGTNFSKILIEINTFSFKKCISKYRLENGSHLSRPQYVKVFYICNDLNDDITVVFSLDTTPGTEFIVRAYNIYASVKIYMESHISSEYYITYRKVSNIRRTKCQNLNDSRNVLQLSVPNPLMPSFKSIMKM